MNPEIEQQVFGYVDPCGPAPGSWKENVLQLIEQAEALNDPNLDEYIKEFAHTQERMMQYGFNAFFKDFKIKFHEIDPRRTT